MASTDDRSSGTPRPDPGKAYGFVIVLTFVSCPVIMATDDDFGAAQRAARHGDPDPVLQSMPGAFMVVWVLQLGIGAVAALTGSARLTRLATPLAWGLLGLWLILYLAVFRPRS